MFATTVIAATALLVAVLCRSAAVHAAPSWSSGGNCDRVACEVAIAAALAIGAACAWPFVFSSDLYAYAAYGAMALRGLNPYALVGSHAHGALVDLARWQWDGTYPVCVYGPLFVALSAAAVALTGHGAVPVFWFLRALGGTAFLATIFAVDSLSRAREPRHRIVAVALYGLNPVALWSVAEGHNDALVLAIAAGGLLVAGRPKLPGGALLVGLGAALKATGTIYAGALAAEAMIFSEGVPRRKLMVRAIAGLAVGIAVSVPLLAGALEVVGHDGRYAPAASLQSLLGLGPTLGVALAAAVYGAHLLGDRKREGYVWFAIALWLSLPDVYPWYALWVLPAVAATELGFASAALWLATISCAVRYLPDAVGVPSVGQDRLVAAVALLPLLVAVAGIVPTLVSKKALIES